jgi:hypothetical protein
MILERAVAYFLVVVCIFQALRPSWTIRTQGRCSPSSSCEQSYGMGRIKRY